MSMSTPTPTHDNDHDNNYDNSYAISLHRRIDERADSQKLPLPLNRKLGDSVVVIDNRPRRMRHVAAAISHRISTTHTIRISRHISRQQTATANAYPIMRGMGISTGACHTNRIHPFVLLSAKTHSVRHNGILIGQSGTTGYIALTLLSQCQTPLSTTVRNLLGAVSVQQQGTTQNRCLPQIISTAIPQQQSHQHSNTSRAIQRDQAYHNTKTVAVPCRYYPIPEPPPPPIDTICRPKPPANRLPLTLTHRRSHLPSHALPLPLTCWHDAAPTIIPNLRSYLVYNRISATIAGINIDPIAFSVKTDMNSYCWQGNVEITARDYAKIKDKLNTDSGQEPLLTVNINGHLFRLICEEQQRRRQFANHSHSISGRSISARLSSDYAKVQGLSGTGLIDQDSYASQIAQQQLNGLGVAIERWDIADWLIPAGSYSITDKTPIAVIADIAKAAGGFIISDPSNATLSLKPRWKKPAWELATTTPDVQLPLDVIRQIDDTRRVNPRHNTVTLVGNKEGGIVYRNGQGRDKDAPVQNNSLYSDRDVIVPAGIAILSDSGIHGEYTVTLRWADKYNLPLAELGQIWQINDSISSGDGAWRGVVTAVSVNVRLENDVPTVWQTVSIDRYLDR